MDLARALELAKGGVRQSEVDAAGGTALVSEPDADFVLEPEVRARLAERGIDPERSYRAFLDEVREQGLPDKLLEDLRRTTL